MREGAEETREEEPRTLPDNPACRSGRYFALWILYSIPRNGTHEHELGGPRKFCTSLGERSRDPPPSEWGLSRMVGSDAVKLLFVA